MYHASYANKRILVISGEPRVLAGIKKELMNYFEVFIAAMGDAALAALKTREVSAIIIYVNQDRENAFSTFADLSEYAADRGIPVLFLAEHDNEGDEIAAFTLGAADYFVKRPAGGTALIHRICLRIRAGENGRALNGAGKALDPAHPEPLLSGKTILIAEDVALNREIMAAILSETDGLTLEFACDGAEAVEKFERHMGIYSLILMDIHMPRMDGLSAARAIRQMDAEAARKIPIIALTASAEEEDVAQCRNAGMDAFLQKPLDYEEFLRVSAEYCKDG